MSRSEPGHDIFYIPQNGIFYTTTNTIYDILNHLAQGISLLMVPAEDEKQVN
jgi:hypothetical protein